MFGTIGQDWCRDAAPCPLEIVGGRQSQPLEEFEFFVIHGQYTRPVVVFRDLFAGGPGDGGDGGGEMGTPSCNRSSQDPIPDNQNVLQRFEIIGSPTKR